MNSHDKRDNHIDVAPLEYPALEKKNLSCY